MRIFINLVVHPFDNNELDLNNKWSNVEIITEFSMGREPLSKRLTHLCYGKLAYYYKRTIIARSSHLSRFTQYEINSLQIIFSGEQDTLR